MGHSPPGSSVHGILQVRMLDQVAIPFCRGSSWPRDQTLIFFTGRWFFTAEPPGSPLLWLPHYRVASSRILLSSPGSQTWHEMEKGKRPPMWPAPSWNHRGSGWRRSETQVHWLHLILSMILWDWYFTHEEIKTQNGEVTYCGDMAKQQQT